MINPKVSVIIPTYNKDYLLGRAIESAINQTYNNLEIIIVDDGSTDNTKKVVDVFLNKYKNIKYFYQDNSGRPSISTNRGIKESSGDFIAILEHDDEWFKDKIKEQVKVLQSDNIGLVSCDAIRIGEKKTYIKSPRDINNIFNRLLETNLIFSASSTLIPRKIFNDVGLFDEKLKNAQDWEMWIRIAQRGYVFKFIKKPLFRYYIHGENLSHISSLDTKENDLNYIYHKYKKYYKGNNKLFSNKLRYDGTRYVLMGYLKKGRDKFIESIKENPINFKSYIYLLISYFGVNIYKKLTEIKSKI